MSEKPFVFHVGIIERHAGWTPENEYYYIHESLMFPFVVPVPEIGEWVCYNRVEETQVISRKFTYGDNFVGVDMIVAPQRDAEGKLVEAQR